MLKCKVNLFLYTGRKDLKRFPQSGEAIHFVGCFTSRRLECSISSIAAGITPFAWQVAIHHSIMALRASTGLSAKAHFSLNCFNTWLEISGGDLHSATSTLRMKSVPRTVWKSCKPHKPPRVLGNSSVVRRPVGTQRCSLAWQDAFESSQRVDN